MTNIITDVQNYTDIADAIRAKLGGSDTYYPSEMASAITSIPSGTVVLQSKSVTPTESQQTVTYDSGYNGLDTVTVSAISSSYVGSGIDRNDSSDLTTSGATVTVPAGYYSTSASASVSNTWWGSLDAEFLYEASCDYTLDDTNYASKTPSTSAQGLNYPATTYTTSAATNPTFDRWGSSYNSGSALDFANYNYFILNDTIIKVAYTSTESSLGIAHTTDYLVTALQPIGQLWRLSSGSPLYPSSSTYGTTSAVQLYSGLNVYRNSSNTQARALTSYGIYATPIVPTFASTSALTCNYINFRCPYWYIRTSSTYMASGAWTYVDTTNTTLKNRQRLYRVEKSGTAETLWNRLGYMFTNQDFPTEDI